MKAGPRGRGAGWRWLAWSALLVGVGCSADHKTSTGRTERETDSVIGQSSLPGASGVKQALESQDSARARAAALDTVGGAE